MRWMALAFIAGAASLGGAAAGTAISAGHATAAGATPKDRDIHQRIHAVIDSLFSLASASPHVDDAVKSYEPRRADAVAVAAGTAAVAHEMFALLRTT